MVVVNHFKSKGSAGPFPGDTDQGDGQGAGNVSRVMQATALAAWIPTVQGDVDDVLLLGDFNSYTEEDPLHVLYDDGYVDLEEESGNEEYSYSFSGLSGSLDHVLANESALERFTGADVWNINAVEPLPMEYSRWNYHSTDFHQPGPYRSSDHDPVIVGLSEPTAEPVATSVSATGGPVTFGTDWTAQVTVNPSTATGTVQVLDGNTSLGTATLSSGSADITISGTALQPGDHTLNVRYLGDAEHAQSASTFTVTVNPVKADVRLEADVKPNKVVVDKTRTRVQIAPVSAPGQKVTGMVRVNWKGKRKTVTLTNGKATVQLGKWGSTGEKHVRVHYLGGGLGQSGDRGGDLPGALQVRPAARVCEARAVTSLAETVHELLKERGETVATA